MTQTILFMVFLVIAIIGIYLIWVKSGNYDADFILRIVGWILLAPAIIGLMQLVP